MAPMGKDDGRPMAARNPYKRKVRTNREPVAPTWARWVTTFRNFFVQLIVEEETEGDGPSVMFYVPHSYNGVKFAIDFTRLSPEELEAVAGLLNSCIDLARPIVQHRDGKAKRNAANGDDSNSRVYRGLPVVVERPWARDLDGQSLLDRPKGFLPRDAGRLDSNEQSGSYGSILAEPDTQADAGFDATSSGSQDHESAPDLTP